MEQLTTTDISEFGRCPECGNRHYKWTPYINIEDKEVGVFCPICYTHFEDTEMSIKEFGYDDLAY